MNANNRSYPWLAQLVPALRSLKDIRYIASSVILEVIFYFIYGIFANPVYGKIQEYISALGMHISQTVKQKALEAANLGSVTSVLFSDETIRSLFFSLFWIFVVLFLIGFCLYTIFYGTLFYLSYRSACRTTIGRLGIFNGFFNDFSLFLRRFFLLNLFWSVFIIGRYAFTFFSDLELYFAQKSMPDAVFTPLVIVSTVFLLVILYFACISYALYDSKKPVRRAFYIGTAQAYSILPAFLITGGIAWILSIVLSLAGELHVSLLYILGLIVLLPFMAVARVYLIRVTRTVADAVGDGP